MISFEGTGLKLLKSAAASFDSSIMSLQCVDTCQVLTSIVTSSLQGQRQSRLTSNRALKSKLV